MTDDVAATLEADPAVDDRYPYRVLYPTNNTFGMGVLSRYPLADATAVRQPTRDRDRGRRARRSDHADQRASGSGRRRAHHSRSIPPRRDREIARVRERIDAALERGDVVLVAGDFNVTPTEPAYRDLVDGLMDAHTEAGLGPGWTWRPKRVEPFGIGVLRIDYVLLGPGLEPVSSTVHCPPTGDHCMVIARVSTP